MIRHTKQRAALTDLLATSDQFASAQTLHEQLRARGENVGLTTVYRNLATLAESGEVDVLTREDGETLYRKCATDAHHHHLVCRNCGATKEIEAHAVETWAERIAAENGYTAVNHTVELVGLCERCSLR